MIISLEIKNIAEYVNNNIEVRSSNRVYCKKAVITIILTVYLSPELSRMQYVCSKLYFHLWPA